MYKLINFHTREEVKTDNFVFTGKTDPWEIEMDIDLIKSNLDIETFKKEKTVLQKFLPFLPLKNQDSLISLYDNPTPLVKSKSIGNELGIDLEYEYRPHKHLFP